MILVTGRRSSRARSDQSAFTLIEVILVIALMTLAAGVIVSNFVAFAGRSGQLTPEEILHRALRTARFEAASSRQVRALRFDKESGSLTLDSGQNFPLDEAFKRDGPASIRLYLAPPAIGLAPAPIPAESNLQTKVLYFAPDRSSSPFSVEIDYGRGSTQRLVFDPFSSLIRD